MARYLNKGKPPGAYVSGYAFFPQGDIAEFPPDVSPSRHWVPLDAEAVECMKRLKAQLLEHAKTKPTAPRGPTLDDIVTEIPSDEPDRSLVEPENDEKTLGQLAAKDDGRISRGPVDDGSKTENDAFATGGRKLTEPEKPTKGRAADKVV